MQNQQNVITQLHQLEAGQILNPLEEVKKRN